MNAKMDLPVVSVVITTRNSAATLGKCLQSVFAQTYYSGGKVEVIVVDNNSTDDTRKIAERNGVRTLLSGPERTTQVNVGARAAQGRYIYWVGSDWILDKHLIEEAVNACKRNNLDAIAIHNTSDPSISFWARVRKFERDFYVSDPLILSVDFFKRDAYLGVGGYDESLVACEEYEMHDRIVKGGYKIGRIASKELHIGEPKALRDVVLKHYYYGKTMLRYIRRSPSRSLRRLSPIRISFIKGWRRFFDDPLVLLGLLLYQYVRYASVGFGVLASL